LDRYAAGDTVAQRVQALPLPAWATLAMRHVFDDLLLCSGLLRAAGDDGTVIYAVDWAAARLRLSSSTVSVALRALRSCGAIRLVKVLPRTEARRRAGSRVYAIASPGDVLPARARPMEAARPDRVDERQEARDDAAVRQAVADDGREAGELDDRLGAPLGGAGGQFRHGVDAISEGRSIPRIAGPRGRSIATPSCPINDDPDLW